MSEQTDKKNKKPRNTGFYTALVLSIAAVGAAAYYAWGSTGGQENLLSSSAAQGARSVAEAVDQTQSNVPQSEPQNTSQSSSEEPDASASSAASSEADEPQLSAPAAFFRPVEGEVAQPFSGNELVKNETMNDWRTHNGTDYTAALSAPVKAVAEGVVLSVTNDPMWGVVVEVDHGGGYVGYYTGLNETVLVQPKDHIAVSTVIGTVGEPVPMELSAGSHFHFELKKDGAYIDPQSVMVQPAE